jgi:arylformamidase
MSYPLRWHLPSIATGALVSRGEIETKIHDISIPIGPLTPKWPGDPDIILERTSKTSDGERGNVARLEIGTHSGTHVDPPAHFFDGTATVDRLDLNMLCGPAFVAEIKSTDSVGREDFEAARVPPGVRRLLLKTSNSTKNLLSNKDFQSNFVNISPEGARWVVDHGVQLIGIDYLSVEAHEYANCDTHRVLLGNRLIILEGIDLSVIDPGHYTLFCLPLKIARGDGAPARVVLVEDL